MGAGASTKEGHEKNQARSIGTKEMQPKELIVSECCDLDDQKNLTAALLKLGLVLRTETRLEHNEIHCSRLFKQPQHELTPEQLKSWCDQIGRNPHSQDLHTEYESLLRKAGAEYTTLGTGFLPSDCLVVVDMQNDFVPIASAPDGGRFGVAEGAACVIPMVTMARRASEAKALIIATKDYHPIDHCSFAENSGPFPAHCVQGSIGARFFPPVKEILREVKAKGTEVKVLYKGFHPRTDSFGMVQYGEQYFTERCLGNQTTPASADCDGSCALDWTGGFVLQCSNLKEDLDAPPDVLAVLSRKTGGDILRQRKVRRIILCGLALDYCVLDSALNAATAEGLAPDGVYMVVDATRAVHIPGVGKYGSGFLTDPLSVVKKCKAAGVQLILSKGI